MKKILTAILFAIIGLLSLNIFSQENKNLPHFLNLDFEEIVCDTPTVWYKITKNHYLRDYDSVVVKSGKYSASIEYIGDTISFMSWTTAIPAASKGRKIKLSGYIKTENINSGYAGLWIRIDPSAGFDNMSNRGIKGTTDWVKVETELDYYPEKSEVIYFGALLSGDGKMWVDDIKLSIDGKDIQSIDFKQKNALKADIDNEFIYKSNISEIYIDDENIDKLYKLGLIWGFVKYYHPKVAEGNYNFDFELFRILPKIILCENNQQLDSTLFAWINGLGEFKESRQSKKSEVERIKFEADLAWINELGFSKELEGLLAELIYAKRPIKHYYIERGFVGNPIFKNEKSYSTMIYPDAGYRILALYRYWNIIQYFFPYRNLIDQDWKQTLKEYIPKFIDAKNAEDFALLNIEIIGRVNDTHANLWGGSPALYGNFYKKYKSAVELKFIQDTLVVSGFLNDTESGISKLCEGDIILTIDNKTVRELLDYFLKYSPASNYSTQLRDIAPIILTSNYKTINISYLRNNDTLFCKINTYPIKELEYSSPNVYEDTSFLLINENIAYINNGHLQKREVDDIMKNVKHCKGLIIDLRNYPSDFPIYKLSNKLHPHRTEFVRFSRFDKKFPGRFILSKNARKAGRKNKNHYKGKVIIIVNETTQSSSEFHAMAYRVHPKALIIGSTTAGADGNVSSINLVGGMRTMISGIGIYYPDGTETQRVGILPDIIVYPTVDGIKNHKDDVLLKAIELINAE